MKNVVSFACVLCVLVVLSPVYAQRTVAEIPYPAEPMYDKAGVEINVTFESYIGEDNMESSNYRIDVASKINMSVEAYVEIFMPVEPERIEITMDERPVEVTKNREYSSGWRYTLKVPMLPFDKKSIELDYKVLRVPQSWNVGLWAIGYDYNSPVYFGVEPTGNEYFNSNPNYNGEINMGYEASDVYCNNCVYVDRKVMVDDASYFSFGWEKKRDPIRAGIVYLLMIFFIGYHLVKRRKGVDSDKK